MLTRVRDLDYGHCREWSLPLDPENPAEPPLRLMILAESGGLLRIGTVSMTSRKETAEELEGQQRVFWCARADVPWLIQHLPEALAFANGAPETPPPFAAGTTPSYKILHPSGRVSWFVRHFTSGEWCCLWGEVKPWRVLGQSEDAL